jgi:phosphatidylserine/phosphatidylglycerophosphate/cardiolipin synthase-like enzyme
MINATRLTYFCPQDDAETALLAQVQSAKKTVRLCDYSYNLQNLTQILISLFKAGVDVSLVLDSSQAKGSTEVPEVTEIKSSGIPLVIGESSDHKIVHSKYVVIDDSIVCSGSYNFTNVAGQEDNFMDVETSSDRAAAFTENWQQIRQWIVTNIPTGVFNQ